LSANREAFAKILQEQMDGILRRLYADITVNDDLLLRSLPPAPPRTAAQQLEDEFHRLRTELALAIAPWLGDDDRDSW
jgi:hypothetical protein